MLVFVGEQFTNRAVSLTLTRETGFHSVSTAQSLWFVCCVLLSSELLCLLPTPTQAAECQRSWGLTALILAFRRQRQEQLCDLTVNLILHNEFQDTQN